MKHLLFILCLGLAQSLHGSIFLPKQITVYSLQYYETYYNQADDPEHIYHNKLSLADYHTLYHVAHGKKSSQKAIDILRNIDQKCARNFMKKLRKRITPL